MSRRSRVNHPAAQVYLVALLALGQGTWAQEPAIAADVIANQDWNDLVAASKAIATAAEMRAESGIADPVPQKDEAAIIASEDGGRVKLTWTPTPNENWAVSASTPLDKSDGTSEFLTLEGAAEDLDLGASLKRFFWPGVQAVAWTEAPDRFEQVRTMLRLPRATSTDSGLLEKELRKLGYSEGQIRTALRALLGDASPTGLGIPKPIVSRPDGKGGP